MYLRKLRKVICQLRPYHENVMIGWVWMLLCMYAGHFARNVYMVNKYMCMCVNTHIYIYQPHF